jgi:Protein of unknown function (DUF2652)
MHRAFHTEQDRMVALKMCSCDACIQAGKLKMKFIAHLGNVARQEIGGRTNLAGVDVIAIHRMLKCSVPVNEYLLMTEELYECYAPDRKPRAQPIDRARRTSGCRGHAPPAPGSRG